MSIDVLLRIMPPPPSPIETGARSWLEIETEIGTRLPQDYKEYIEKYGSGRIGDFIAIFNPFSANRHTNILDQIPKQTEILNHFKRTSPSECPYPIFPEAAGLLPFGGTDNGDRLYWVTDGEPDSWWIAVNESRGPTFSEHKCDMTQFLADILTLKTVCAVFPDDFPDGDTSFKPSERG